MSIEAPSLVFQDAALLVWDKPPGLLCVPGRGADKQDCLSARAQSRFDDALVVHRLDMATSGLVLMARGKPAQQTLSHAFAERQVHKTYVALVHGCPVCPSDDWGLIDLPIALDWPNRPRRIVQAENGKPSQTRWRVLTQGTTPHARVELEPVTGRSHQLRVHMMSIGHSIVGDPMYSLMPGDAAQQRLFLHAARLRFRHPVTDMPMDFISPVPF